MKEITEITEKMDNEPLIAKDILGLLQNIEIAGQIAPEYYMTKSEFVETVIKHHLSKFKTVKGLTVLGGGRFI